VEAVIAIVACTALAAVVVILAFVAREALGGGAPTPSALLLPRTWPGYEVPTWVWQPVGAPPKFSLVPLVVGTFKVTAIALAASAPLSFGAALFVSEVVSARVRAYVKPAIEVLAGLPSVLLGFIALDIVAPWLQRALHTTYALNALVAGLALAVAVVPIVFSVAEDALHAVPRELREAAAALGARRWQTSLLVVLPSALPGLVGATVLGFGRAIGETMIVLMASGNAAVVGLRTDVGARTLTATIAAEVGEAERGGEHWRVLFVLGLLLIVTTFVLESLGRRAADRVARRFDPEGLR